MKYLAALLLGTPLLAAALGAAAQRGGMPYPPGLRQAEISYDHINFPPPAFPPQSGVTPQKLAQEADELNSLAAQVQKEVAMANQGALPRDLPKNLKEIEKLAHHLRSQLTR